MCLVVSAVIVRSGPSRKMMRAVFSSSADVQGMVGSARAMCLLLQGVPITIAGPSSFTSDALMIDLRRPLLVACVLFLPSRTVYSGRLVMR